MNDMFYIREGLSDLHEQREEAQIEEEEADEEYRESGRAWRAQIERERVARVDAMRAEMRANEEARADERWLRMNDNWRNNRR